MFSSYYRLGPRSVEGKTKGCKVVRCYAIDHFIFSFSDMIVLYFLGLLLATMGAVLIPRLVPVLCLSVERLLSVNIYPVWILLVYVIAAVFTTSSLWYFDGVLHQRLKKKNKNHQRKHGLSRKARRWFDRTFSIVRNPRVLCLGIFLGSPSVIPDVFLVEFARDRLPFTWFIIAIFLGKIWAGLVIIYGVDLLFSCF